MAADSDCAASSLLWPASLALDREDDIRRSVGGEPFNMRGHQLKGGGGE
jgi:hypothetical protein